MKITPRETVIMRRTLRRIELEGTKTNIIQNQICEIKFLYKLLIILKITIIISSCGSSILF
jgi:hypothetical protein